ncbi:MAG: phosphohydrolase [Treponema sp.]|nr:phosphohydrolase [Treponema sp.]
MKSSKELGIDITLIDLVESFNLSRNVMKCLKLLLASDEIQAEQEFANTVSIIRLGFNDHGPVHMRTATYNALLMMSLLKKAGIKTSIEKDGCGDFEDSLIAVMLAAMFHDLGMQMGRTNHELHSTIFALPLINSILVQVFPENLQKRVIIRAVALEGIAGHMGTISISSLEAGIIQIADGCDMTKGRARIPISLASSTGMGHIHQYSANAIETVNISQGEEKPIRIDIHMTNEAGVFQIEEVLMHKVSGSTAKKYIELYASVRDEAARRYL